jgi:hypothetical protein
LQTVYTGSKTINTGKLLAGTGLNVELMPSLPILAGNTSIKVWLNAPLDSLVYDDTIRHTYYSEKLALPIDENFNSTSMPYEFKSTPDNASGWQPYTPVGGTQPQPNMGSSMLRYAGARGTMAKLSTSYQIDMYGAVNPKMILWYYHDTTSNERDNSYTDVNVILDGGAPQTILHLLKRSGPHGWVADTIDLSPYTNAQCALIEFESMNKYDGSAQYIDRIIITSEEDLEVSRIVVSPSVTACDFTNKKIEVVISTRTTQAIDFSKHPNTKIALVIQKPGRSDTLYSQPLQGVIAGRTSETILIPSNIDFVVGVNTLKAFLTNSLDGNKSNDTIRQPLVVDINPSVSLRIVPFNNRQPKDRIVGQDVWIKNTGNMDLSKLAVIFNIMDEKYDNVLTTIHDTVYGTISKGDSVKITFEYRTPILENYKVNAKVSLTCAPALVKHDTIIRESVDMEDLLIERIVKPQAGTTDAVGASNQVEVLLRNTYDNDFQDVIITARIEDANGDLINNLELRDVISLIRGDTAINHQFTKTYTVPEVSSYFIKVFLGKQDEYPQNDTVVSEERHTSLVGIVKGVEKTFALQQNIPNPAKNTTTIEYSIPASGEVIFKVQTVSGQILHTEVFQSEAGKQFIELDTRNFAAGVYFYSVEYNEQKLVKRMIKR